MIEAYIGTNLKDKEGYYNLKGGSMKLHLWLWDGKRLDSVKTMREEAGFDADLKEDNMTLDGVWLSRWEKLEILFVPKVFSRMILLEEKSKGFLDPMGFFDDFLVEIWGS